MDLGLSLGGDYKRSGYMQYVPVILANIPARTTFIDIYNHVRYLHVPIALNRPRYVHAPIAIARAEQT